MCVVVLACSGVVSPSGPASPLQLATSLSLRDPADTMQVMRAILLLLPPLGRRTQSQLLLPSPVILDNPLRPSCVVREAVRVRGRAVG